MSSISKDLNEKISFIENYDNQDEQIFISKDFENEPIKKVVKQTENILTDIYNLLTPTSKKECLWELYDGNSKIKAKMEDTKFFNNYINNFVKLGRNEKLKIKMKIETYIEDKKIKKNIALLLLSKF